MSEKVIYEIGYLIIPNISEEDVLTEVVNIKAILEKQEANFLSGDEPKLINLAYPISKMFGTDKQIFEKAYFAWMKFEIEVDKLVEIKEELDKYENILRYLLVKTLKKDTLVSDNKRAPFIKKDVIITDKQKEKEIKPVKIVPKSTTEQEKEEETTNIEIKEDNIKTKTEKEKKDKENLDETIDNLIIK